MKGFVILTCRDVILYRDLRSAASSHTNRICLLRSQITNQWVSHFWLWVFNCLPDCSSGQQQNKAKESWFWFWTRGWEVLSGWEWKGRAVPENTVREKFRFVFPGKTDFGIRPHSCPVIHMWCLSIWPEACLNGVKWLMYYYNSILTAVWWLFTAGLCWWGTMHSAKKQTVHSQTLNNVKL